MDPNLATLYERWKVDRRWNKLNWNALAPELESNESYCSQCGPHPKERGQIEFPRYKTLRYKSQRFKEPKLLVIAVCKTIPSDLMVLPLSEMIGSTLNVRLGLLKMVDLCST